MRRWRCTTLPWRALCGLTTTTSSAQVRGWPRRLGAQSDIDDSHMRCKQAAGKRRAYGVTFVGTEKPSLGAHKAKHPPGRAVTQRGTTQRQPAS